MDTTSSSTQDNPDESGSKSARLDADPRLKKEAEIHISFQGKGNIFSATGDVNIGGDLNT